MPQLDFGTYSNIVFWFLLSISIFYMCIQEYIIDTYTFFNIIKPLYRRFLKKTFHYRNALTIAIFKRRELYRQFSYFNYQNLLIKLKKDSFNFLIKKIHFNIIRQKNFNLINKLYE
jgi:hypothetical protein